MIATRDLLGIVIYVSGHARQRDLLGTIVCASRGGPPHRAGVTTERACSTHNATPAQWALWCGLLMLWEGRYCGEGSHCHAVGGRALCEAWEAARPVERLVE
jgi:hypothetical protein